MLKPALEAECSGGLNEKYRKYSRVQRERSVGRRGFLSLFIPRVKGTPFLKHGGQGVNEIRLLRYVTAQVPARRVSRGRLSLFSHVRFYSL